MLRSDDARRKQDSESGAVVCHESNPSLASLWSVPPEAADDEPARVVAPALLVALVQLATAQANSALAKLMPWLYWRSAAALTALVGVEAMTRITLYTNRATRRRSRSSRRSTADGRERPADSAPTRRRRDR